jgi:uncharacterized protein (TIGR02217 family)
MFRDVEFPREFAYGVTGGPEYATDLFTSPGGYEARQQHWRQSRGRWTVSFQHRTAAEIAPLLHFFRAVAHGRAFSFRFHDYTDYTFDNVIGTGDGGNTDHYLRKLYTSGSSSVYRLLRAPVAATLVVTLDGVVTTDYTLFAQTGMLRFAVPPAFGAVIAASGEFDVPVRCGSDRLPLQYVSVDAFTCDALELLEVLQEEPDELS